MRTPVALLQTTNAAVDVTTVGFDLLDLTCFSIQVTFSGGASDIIGVLKLQASLDNSVWVDVSNSSQAVAASASHIWDVTKAGYKLIRVNWDWTSGSGNIGIQLWAKEDRYG